MTFEIWQAPAGRGAFDGEYNPDHPWEKVWSGDAPAGAGSNPIGFCDLLFHEFQRVQWTVRIIGGSERLIGTICEAAPGTEPDTVQVWVDSIGSTLVVMRDQVETVPGKTHMPPEEYTGRSLTAGDLIRVGDTGWFFCEFAGWGKVDAPKVTSLNEVIA